MRTKPEAPIGAAGVEKLFPVVPGSARCEGCCPRGGPWRALS